MATTTLARRGRALTRGAAAAILTLAAGCGPTPQPAPQPAPAAPAAEPGGPAAISAAAGGPFARLAEALDRPPEERAETFKEWAALERFRGAVTDEFDRNNHVTAVAVFDPATDADFAALADLPHLTFLDVSRVDPEKVTDAAFEHVARLPRLERLVATGLPLTDAACRHIGRVASLKTLELAKTRVSDDGLPHLNGLTNLEALDLAGTTVSGEGLGTLKLPRLTALDLRGVRLRTHDLEAVGRFTALRRLLLPDVLASDPHPAYAPPDTTLRLGTAGEYPPLPAGTINYAAGVRHLAGLVHLERSDMTKAFPAADVTRTLGYVAWDVAKLTELRLARTLFVRWLEPLSPEEVVRRHGIRRAASGEFVMNEFRNGETTSFPLMEQRPEFAEFLNRPCGKLLAHLGAYRHVTSLDLSGFAVYDDDLAHLERHIGLERLDLSGSPITATGIARLKSLPKLRYLNLSGANVGDADLPAIKELPALRDVVLSQTRVTQAGADTFRRGAARAVYDPKQPRPWWCDIDWRALFDEPRQ